MRRTTSQDSARTSGTPAANIPLVRFADHSPEHRKRAIARLLAPRSIAVIGASATPGALGASVLSNLDRMGYRGEVYLVNPNRASIGNRPCLANAEELPEGVDAAVLAIPKSAVLDNLEALVRRRAGSAVIFSAGFAEDGESGAREQSELARLSVSHDLLIEGPNCLGFVNQVDGVALTFVETRLDPPRDREGIGIVSQSGALAAVLGVMLTSRDLAVSYSISTGNEAATGVEDYLEYLLEEAHTHVLGLIVEQFRQPQRLLRIARRARALGKSIVLLHPGRSQAARDSATTHTGAIVGDYEVMSALVRRAGILLVESLEELGDVLEILARSPYPPRRGMALLTESGAFKALALDLAEQIDLQLPTITDADSPALRSVLPAFVPVSNPLDLTAQALIDPDLYRRTLAALLDDDRFGSILLGIIQTDARTSHLKFPAIIGAIETLAPAKSILFSGLDEGAAVPAQYLARLRELGVPCFVSPGRALRALARLSREARPGDGVELPVLRLALDPGQAVLAEHRAKQVLQAGGLPFPRRELVASLEEALAAANRLGYPLALKAQAAALTHKSDAGGVVLGIGNAQALSQAWMQMHIDLAQRVPELALEGFLIERMSEPGIELIVGARNDPDWGPVIIVGTGGVHAELLHDVQVLPVDLPESRIVEALHSLRLGALLKGYRGAPAADVGAAAKVISKVGAIIANNPRILEIELNPVRVHPKGQGATALDALIVIGHDAHEAGTA